MTRDSAVSIIANRLGQRTGLSAQIVAEMKLLQEDLEGRPELPWFLEHLYGPSSQSAKAVTLPSTPPDSFLREIADVGLLWLVESDGSYTELFKDDYNHLLQSEDTQDAGKPQYYAMLGGVAYLFPTPDQAYNLELRYVRKDVVLDTDVENLWLANASDLMVAGTGLRIAQFLRDQGMMQLFKADKDGALGKLTMADAARGVAGAQLFMGG